jgi:cyclase
MLNAGADKVAVNSAAVKDKYLVARAAEKFGSQCVVVAIDAKRTGDKFNVYIHGGRTDTGIDAVEWAEEVESLGCGEILLTSMDADGTKNGFDLELTDIISKTVNIPVIASGGCGALQHFADVFEKTGADAALAATLFHFRELTIGEVKDYLKEKGIWVRH